MQQQSNFESFPITVTNAAIEKIKSSTKNSINKIFRISIVSGGCSGFSTEFTISDIQDYNKEEDILLEVYNVKIALNKAFVSIINGGVLDFSSNLIGDKFILTIPNSKDSCGCGSSFSL